MKKIILFVVVAISLSLLTACPNNESISSNLSSNHSNQIPDTSSSEIIDNKDDTSDTPQAVVSVFSNATDYSNGFAFVQYTGDEKTYCIDTTGKQLFALENCNINMFAMFNGKIAMILDNNSIEYFLCDKAGKIYTAEDLGASRIVLNTENHEQAFLDGYIILERRNESYTGTTIEMSIMDSDFNTLVPFSVDLAEVINSNPMNVNGTNYYDGYLYVGNTILDLRTGMLLTDRRQMEVSSPKLAYFPKGTYGGSFDHLEWGDIYNAITGDVIANAEDSEYITSVFFIDDLGLATYNTGDGIWFSIIGTDGAVKFQPIASTASIQFDGEIILVTSSEYIEKDNTRTAVFTLKTYDVSGNLLKEVSLEGSLSATLNDGVIRIYDWENRVYSFLNTDLEELF